MHVLQVFSCYMWLIVPILDNEIQSIALTANVLLVPEGDWEEPIVMATLLRALLNHQTHSLDNVDPRACISPVSPCMEHTSPILHCRKSSVLMVTWPCVWAWQKDLSKWCTFSLPQFPHLPRSKLLSAKRKKKGKRKEMLMDWNNCLWSILNQDDNHYYSHYH